MVFDDQDLETVRQLVALDLKRADKGLISDFASNGSVRVLRPVRSNRR